MSTFTAGFYIYPGVTALDFIGPAQVISQVSGLSTLYVSDSLDPVPTDAKLSVQPTHTFESCPPLDVLCVPGGPGQAAKMQDDKVLNFLRKQGEQAKYVTSVCTGSLLLAKAGLLEGYQAGCHWAWKELLQEFGAIACDERVVQDRNRITGGGVTAGIDFALTLVAQVFGEQVAQAIQLGLEYDPMPPFNCGSPRCAPEPLVATVKSTFEKHFPVM